MADWFLNHIHAAEFGRTASRVASQALVFAGLAAIATACGDDANPSEPSGTAGNGGTAAGSSGAGAGGAPSAGRGGNSGAGTGGITNNGGGGRGGNNNGGGRGGTPGTGGQNPGGSSSGGAAGSQTETVCGGFAGSTCSSEEYCAYEAGQFCGAADASAVCMPRPDACATIFAPVCGCDSMPYGNACDAAAAGTGVLMDGDCP